MEKIVYKIINSKRNKWIVTLIVLFSMGAAVMMIPTKLVLARMLPGKSANTMSIYVDTQQMHQLWKHNLLQHVS